ncbi:MerR family transcriptional regulator [Deinococcus sp. UYEF24]
MSGHALPGSWSGTLEEFSQLANTLLPQYLPLDRSSRTQDEVNPRLIRHYTTQGLLSPPFKAGREARYTRHHLLQLLTLRRLMTEGHSAQALQQLLGQQSDADLEALLTGEVRLQVQSRNPALEYLEGLKTRSSRLAAAPPSSALPAPSLSALSLPAPPRPAAPADPFAKRYSRLTLAPGLELHVSTDARLPKTSAEQDALARQLIAALDTLRRTP